MTESVRQAEVLFSIVKSCMGAGVFNYPEMFNLYGLALVLFMTFTSGIASVLGALAYINLNTKYRKENSISTLASRIVSPIFKYFVDFVVIAKCIVVAAGYLSLAKELIENIPVSTGFEIIDKNLKYKGFAVTLVGSLCLIPNILGHSLTSLKTLSYLGTLSIVSLIVISQIQTEGMQRDSVFFTDKLNILGDVGTFVFGFTCHQSILNIHNDSQIKDQTIKILISLAFTIVGIFYLAFGYVNYSAFYPRITNMKNVFTMWQQNYFTNSAAFIFALSLLISVPFQLHPAKTYFGDFFGLKQFGRKITVCCMISLCYVLSCASWYDIALVSRNVTKPMNTMLCFGFPLIFTLFDKGKKSAFGWFYCFYLTVFIGICVASYF